MVDREYQEWAREQFGQVGSGLLGGWTRTTQGGFVDVHARAERELWQELRAYQRLQAQEQQSAVAVAESEHHTHSLAA